MAPNAAVDDNRRLRDEFKRLNELFYADPPPAAYFEHRLDLLLFTTYTPEKLTGLELDYERGKLRVGRKAHPDLGAEDRTTFSRVATVEATILCHHVAETLLRLYLAHEPISPCPWLLLAGLTEAGAFKQAVRERFCSGALDENTALARVLRVFVGSADRKALKLSSRAWTKHRARARNTNAILTHLAELILDDAHLYNAAKHGMAINPGAAFAYINAVQVGHGPSITYLELERVQAEGATVRRYRMTTSWINLEYMIAVMHWACALMDTLWCVARARYCEGSKTIQFYDLPELDEALKVMLSHNEGLLRSRMSMSLPIIEPPRTR